VDGLVTDMSNTGFTSRGFLLVALLLGAVVCLRAWLQIQGLAGGPGRFAVRG
jgi:hypothetical protein